MPARVRSHQAFDHGRLEKAAASSTLIRLPRLRQQAQRRLEPRKEKSAPARPFIGRGRSISLRIARLAAFSTAGPPG